MKRVFLHFNIFADDNNIIVYFIDGARDNTKAKKSIISNKRIKHVHTCFFETGIFFIYGHRTRSCLAGGHSASQRLKGSL